MGRCPCTVSGGRVTVARVQVTGQNILYILMPGQMKALRYQMNVTGGHTSEQPGIMIVIAGLMIAIRSLPVLKPGILTVIRDTVIVIPVLMIVTGGIDNYIPDQNHDGTHQTHLIAVQHQIERVLSTIELLYSQIEIVYCQIETVQHQIDIVLYIIERLYYIYDALYSIYAPLYSLLKNELKRLNAFYYI